MARSGLGFLRRGRHLLGSLVDRGHQRSQLVDGVVHRVGDRAGDVLRHRGLHGQVAFGQRAHFVQQAHDRLLVALVQLGTLGETLALVGDQGDDQQQGKGHRGDRAEQAPPHVREQPAQRQFADLVGQVVGAQQHGLRIQRGLVAGALHVGDVGRGGGQLGHRIGQLGPVGVHLGEDLARVGVGDRPHAAVRVALDQALEHVAVQLRVARQAVGGGLGVVTALQHLLHAADDAVGGQHLARGTQRAPSELPLRCCDMLTTPLHAGA
ncbi:hypothetical protein RLIN73S_06917 [Rhodanobacter lindaniclasticus]